MFKKIKVFAFVGPSGTACALTRIITANFAVIFFAYPHKVCYDFDIKDL